MNTHSAPQHERPLASGTNGPADDVPLTPDQSEPALRPVGSPAGEPDRQEGSGQPGHDDDDDEYEPL